MKSGIPLLAIFAIMCLLVSPTIHGVNPLIYVDRGEVEGLLESGNIPIGGAIKVPIRFINIYQTRTYISNGYVISGSEGVSWTSITGEWNPQHPWVSPVLYQPDPWFDLGIETEYFDNGVGFQGEASPDGLGMPSNFAGIAYYITISGIAGETGDVLTLDSSWWAPSNYWVWSGTEVDWWGPYEFTLETPPPGPPEIVSVPSTIARVGELYTYDMDAVGNPEPTYYMTIFPDGATIDPVTGLVEWIPQNATIPNGGSVPFQIYASNTYGEVYQYFGVAIYPDEPWTTCWPQPLSSPKTLENDGILNVIIHEEDNDQVVFESIRVQGRIPPYTEARIEGDSIVTDCWLMQFLGMSRFRPIPSQGIFSTYTVEYDKVDGSHMVLTGDFVMAVFPGDVNFDGQVDDDDLQAMRDYLFNRGEPMEFEEFMDVDRNGRIDLMDMRELVRIIAGKRL